MGSKTPKVTFIVPTNRHEVKWLVNDILSIFPTAKIVIIDDGKGLRKPSSEQVILVKHRHNLGLAISLKDGYLKALTTNPDIIVRADADKEYPLYPVKHLISKLYESEDFSGCYVETKRTVETSGVADWLFHTIFGIIEGRILFNKIMHQHSPGLHIYKYSTVRYFAPLLSSIIEKYQLKWGLDLIILFFAGQTGEIMQFTANNPDWRERRPVTKIFSQIKHATKIMSLIRQNRI